MTIEENALIGLEKSIDDLEQSMQKRLRDLAQRAFIFALFACVLGGVAGWSAHAWLMQLKPLWYVDVAIPSRGACPDSMETR